MDITELSEQVKKLPRGPGVYIFRSADHEIVYVGKAKDLRARMSSYVQRFDTDWKVNAIVTNSQHLDYQNAGSELEAMLLEAELIQSNRPKFNVLLKDGNPFIYFVITRDALPELKIVRTTTTKGTYFGPFIERSHARQVYEFLMRTFALRLCHKKMPSGCLYYHMGLCAGTCKPDFDREGYLERLALAQDLLTRGHAQLLNDLQEKIDQHNQNMEFEQSRRLHKIYEALCSVTTSLQSLLARPGAARTFTERELWVWCPQESVLARLYEWRGALKIDQLFYIIPGIDAEVQQQCEEIIVSYYRSADSAQTVLINVPLADVQLLADFITTWHHKDRPVDIMIPTSGHNADLIALSQAMVAEAFKKKRQAPIELQRMLKLRGAPRIIDCFDISHKQGLFLVGACVRFVDGAPDKNKFRRFKIRTVVGSDDYASLHEVVQRRYASGKDLPDLVLIDGGKGQLNAVKELVAPIECISLAKREERIFCAAYPEGKKLDPANFAAQILIALRDYTHHFAISYHKHLADKIS